MTEQTDQTDTPVAKTAFLAVTVGAFATYLFATGNSVAGVWFALLAFGVVVQRLGRTTAEGQYVQAPAAWVATYTFCLGMTAYSMLVIVGAFTHEMIGLGVAGVLSLALSIGLTWFWVRAHVAARRSATTS